MDRRPPGPSAAGRWLAVSIVAAVLVFGVTACSDDDDDPKVPTATVGTSPPATEPATTTTTIEDVEAEVEAAYLEAEEAFYRVATAPDPSDPRLARYYAEEALERVRSILASSKKDGVVVEFRAAGPPASDISSVDVDGDSKATLVTCTVDDSIQIRVQSGDTVNDVISTYRQEVKMTRMEGHWVVTGGEVIGKVAKC